MEQKSIFQVAHAKNWQSCELGKEIGCSGQSKNAFDSPPCQKRDEYGP
jgi:hypothetical protein